MSGLAPAAPRGRIEVIDTIRGFALLGIMLVNILVFGLPIAALFDPTVDGATAGIDFGIFFTMELLFEGAMRTQFCMLFGAGIVMLTARGKGAAIYYKRQLISAWPGPDQCFRAAVDRRHPDSLCVRGDDPVSRPRLAAETPFHRGGLGIRLPGHLLHQSLCSYEFHSGICRNGTGQTGRRRRNNRCRTGHARRVARGGRVFPSHGGFARGTSTAIRRRVPGGIFSQRCRVRRKSTYSDCRFFSSGIPSLACCSEWRSSRTAF